VRAGVGEGEERAGGVFLVAGVILMPPLEPPPPPPLLAPPPRLGSDGMPPPNMPPPPPPPPLGLGFVVAGALRSLVCDFLSLPFLNLLMSPSSAPRALLDLGGLNVLAGGGGGPPIGGGGGGIWALSM
jgi:hypothetical protein